MAMVVMVCAAMSGCVRHAPFQPAVRPTQANAAQLYKAAIRVMSDRGLAPATNDRDGGIVMTEWDEASDFAGGKSKTRWRIMVDDGSVRVDADCQRFQDGIMGGEWLKCEVVPPEAQAAADSMADDIVAAAQ